MATAAISDPNPSAAELEPATEESDELALPKASPVAGPLATLRPPNPHLNSGLRAAVEENDVSRIENLLAQGTEINYKGFVDESTALHLASKLNYPKAVEALLAHRPDANIKDGVYGLTPLGVAATNGHEEVIKVLLKYPSIDPNTIDDDHKRTPLHIAVQNGHEAAVNAFLAATIASKKVSIDAEDIDGLTPVHIAAQEGYNHILKSLLEANAKINEKNKDGDSPLHLAARGRRSETLKTLLEKEEVMVNIRNDNEKTPLHSVFDLGDSSSSDDDKIIAIVTALLEKGADTGATESLNGETPLHMAARKETPGGVGALLPKANVNSRNNRGYTPLSIAIRHKQIEIVHLMLDKADPEADLKLKGPMDNLVSPVTTVLETAICKGNIEIVKLFLQPTRSTLRYIDTPWESVLCTPLTWAVHEGNFKLTEILLESGARIDVEDKNSDSPLRLSSSLGNIDITELLLKYNPRVDLKEHGSDWTALHYASYYGHHKITELIVKKGADARLGQPKAPRKWTITEFPQVVV